MKGMSHLSVIDGVFLHLQSPDVPMHVGSLVLFDPLPAKQGPGFSTVKAHVASRMHLAPVFTCKLAVMPFDWDYHIRYLVLSKPGAMTKLKALVARLHSSLLTRSRPRCVVIATNSALRNCLPQGGS